MTARTLFDAGPEGAAVTTANSGVALAATSTGGTVTYAASKAAHGSFGLNSVANNATAIVRINTESTDNTQALSFVFTTPDVAPGSGAVTFLTARTNPAAIAGRWQWLANGQLQMGDQPNTFSVVTAPGVLALGTKYRLEVLLVGGSTSAGKMSTRIFDMAGNLKGSASVTNANMTANPITAFDFGNQGGISTTISMGYDDIQISTGATSEIGPYTPGANNAPNVSAGSNQTVNSGQTVNLTGTASDGDGSIASVAWTWDYVSNGSSPTITGANSLNASFPAAAAGVVYRAKLTATDNGGATAYSLVTVYSTADTVSVIGVTDNSGAWLPNPSGSTLNAVLADLTTDASGSSTYVESPASPVTAASVTLRLAPLKPLTTMTLALLGAAVLGSGALTCQAQLLEGTTVRKTWTFTPTATPAEIDLVLDSTSASTIGSWNALDVKLSATAV